MLRISIWLRAAVVFASPRFRNTVGPTIVASAPMIAITTIISISVKPAAVAFRCELSNVGLRGTEHLLDGRNACFNLQPSILLQSHMTRLIGQLLQHAVGRGGCDRRTQFRRNDQ